MVDAWEVASIVAVVAGVVGFFTVLRGSAFAAHALPNGAFAGAAGAVLIGASTLLGLAAFALLGALVIVWIALAASYQTDYPVGFFVGSGSAIAYAAARAFAARRRRPAPEAPIAALPT